MHIITDRRLVVRSSPIVNSNGLIRVSQPVIIKKEYYCTEFVTLHPSVVIHFARRSQSSVRKGATINPEGVERLHSGLSAHA